MAECPSLDGAYLSPAFYYLRIVIPSESEHSREFMTQLLVQKSPRESLFYATHYILMTGHFGEEKMLAWLLLYISSGGLCGEISQSCAFEDDFHEKHNKVV